MTTAARGRRARRRRGGHLLGMRIATVLAAFLLAAGLVVRMSAPLTVSSPTARTAIAPDGTLDLSADRATPLFDGVALVPGRATSACVRLEVRSADDPAPITLAIGGFDGSRALAEAIQLTVEHGHGAEEGGDCSGFTPSAVVATGSLAELGVEHGQGGAPLGTSDPAAGTSEVWFRLTALLPDSAPAAVAGSVVEHLDLLWATSIVPPDQARLRDQALRVLAGVAEHSVVPLMLMLVLAVMFLGIQDRIDRRDPKLAAAPIVRGALAFEPRRPDVDAT